MLQQSCEVDIIRFVLNNQTLLTDLSKVTLLCVAGSLSELRVSTSVFLNVIRIK